MVVITFGDAQLLFTPSPIEEMNNRNIKEAYVLHNSWALMGNKLLNDMAQGFIKTVVVVGEPASRLEEVKQAMRCLKAGGGLVVNDRDELLMIYRNGVWDLPKGKWEQGESMMECARREVEEETGISDIQVGSLIDITRHIYSDADGYIVKENHWYHMQAPNQVLVPQTEEGISEACWVPRNSVHKYLLNTYFSIKYLVEKSGYV